MLPPNMLVISPSHPIGKMKKESATIVMKKFFEIVLEEGLVMSLEDTLACVLLLRCTDDALLALFSLGTVTTFLPLYSSFLMSYWLIGQ